MHVTLTRKMYSTWKTENKYNFLNQYNEYSLISIIISHNHIKAK